MQLKLKTVFILFNIIVVLTFLMVFLMPLFFLGFEFTTVFWRGNWYLAVLFLAILAVLNTYFLLNWRLFRALEQEDWEAICGILEERVLQNGRASDSNIRLLVNACVVSSRTDTILKVEQALRERKPRALRKHCLRLAVPHLLSNDGQEIETYFEEFRGKKADPWIEWGYAFGLLLQGRMEPGREVLESIVAETPRGIVTAVSLYLLSAYGDTAIAPGETTPDETTPDEIDSAETVARRKREFVEAIPRAQWKKRVERERVNLHVLILSKLLVDVENWMYGNGDGHGEYKTHE